MIAIAEPRPETRLFLGFDPAHGTDVPVWAEGYIDDDGKMVITHVYRREELQ